MRRRAFIASVVVFIATTSSMIAQPFTAERLEMAPFAQQDSVARVFLAAIRSERYRDAWDLLSDLKSTTTYEAFETGARAVHGKVAGYSGELEIVAFGFKADGMILQLRYRFASDTQRTIPSAMVEVDFLVSDPTRVNGFYALNSSPQLIERLPPEDMIVQDTTWIIGGRKVHVRNVQVLHPDDGSRIDVSVTHNTGGQPILREDGRRIAITIARHAAESGYLDRGRARADAAGRTFSESIRITLIPLDYSFAFVDEIAPEEYAR